MLNRQIRARCRIRPVEVSLRAVCQTSPVVSGEGRWEGFGFVKSGEIAATLKQSALARVGIPDTHFFSGGGGIPNKDSRHPHFFRQGVPPGRPGGCLPGLPGDVAPGTDDPSEIRPIRLIRPIGQGRSMFLTCTPPGCTIRIRRWSRTR